MCDRMVVQVPPAPPGDGSMHLVAFRQEELQKVGSILPGNAGNQRFPFRHTDVHKYHLRRLTCQFGLHDKSCIAIPATVDDAERAMNVRPSMGIWPVVRNGP